MFGIFKNTFSENNNEELKGIINTAYFSRC